MSTVPRSPTAVDITIDPSQPEWKRELIRQKNLRKRSLIRLPTVMIERERKISSATNGDLLSPALALPLAPAANPDSNNLRSPRITSGNPDGMNGFPRSKSSITLNNNNQSMKVMPNLRSQSFENDIQIISSQPETDGKSHQQLILENSITNNFNQGSFSGRKTPSPVLTSPTTTWQQFLNRNKDADRYKGSQKVEMKNEGFELKLESTKNNVSKADGMNGNIDEYVYDGEDSDSENDYGPGIVNRMKAKFINLSQHPDPPAPVPLVSPTSPVPMIRQASSLEDLLDIESGDELEDRSELGSGFVARKKDLFKHNANAVRGAFSFLPRARSMDLLTNSDQSPYINQSHLKTAATGSKKIIIIEQSKLSATEDVVDSSMKKALPHSKNSVPDLGRSLSPNIDRNEDLPIPKSVLECVKLFQQTDEAKFIYSKPMFDHPAVKVPPIPPPLPQKSSPIQVIKPFEVIILDEQVNQKNPPKLVHEPIIAENFSMQPNKPNLEIEAISSVKSLREAYVNNINSQPLQRNFSSASPEPVVKIEKPKVVTETPKPVVSIHPFKDEPIAPTLPSKPPPVIYNMSKPNLSKPPLTNGHKGGGKNTIVIVMEDDKKDKSHLPVIDDDYFVPNFTLDYQNHTSGKDKSNGIETDDDVMGESFHSKSVNFIGANIIVGRSSLLKTRNKKLQLLFDDKALSTYEYPSEWTLLNERPGENEDCDSTPNILKSDEPRKSNNSSSTTGGGISNYTPLALSKDQVFELGMSPVSQIETARSVKNSNVGHPQENGDLELSIKPGDECENVLWSNTQTVDILF